jgi:hypothetical protein
VYILRDINVGRLENRAEVEWQFDLEKQFVLRERLISITLLPPPPAC